METKKDFAVISPQGILGTLRTSNITSGQRVWLAGGVTADGATLNRQEARVSLDSRYMRRAEECECHFFISGEVAGVPVVVEWNEDEVQS